MCALGKRWDLLGEDWVDEAGGMRTRVRGSRSYICNDPTRIRAGWLVLFFHSHLSHNQKLESGSEAFIDMNTVSIVNIMYRREKCGLATREGGSDMIMNTTHSISPQSPRVHRGVEYHPFITTCPLHRHIGSQDSRSPRTYLVVPSVRVFALPLIAHLLPHCLPRAL